MTEETYQQPLFEDIEQEDHWVRHWQGMPHFHSEQEKEPEITAIFKFRNKDDFLKWKERWKIRLSVNNNDKTSEKTMKKSNPVVIPRNHLVEDALKTAETGDLKKTNRLLKVLSEPYKIQSSIQDLQTSPKPSKIPYKTFCGT